MFPLHGALLKVSRSVAKTTRRKSSYRCLVEVLENRQNPTTIVPVLIGEDAAWAEAPEEVHVAPPVDLIDVSGTDVGIIDDLTIDQSDIPEPLVNIGPLETDSTEWNGASSDDLAGANDEATANEGEVVLEDPQIQAELQDVNLIDVPELPEAAVEPNDYAINEIPVEMLAYSSIPGMEFPTMPDSEGGESSVPAPIEEASSGIGEATPPVEKIDTPNLEPVDVIAEEANTDAESVALAPAISDEYVAPPIPVAEISSGYIVTFVIPTTKQGYTYTQTVTTPVKNTLAQSQEASDELHAESSGTPSREGTQLIDGSGYGDSALPTQDFAGFPTETPTPDAPTAVAAKEE